MTDEEKVQAMTVVLRNYDLDENLGDTTERFETLLSIATDGTEGRDWGHPRTEAEEPNPNK